MQFTWKNGKALSRIALALAATFTLGAAAWGQKPAPKPYPFQNPPGRSCTVDRFHQPAQAAHKKVDVLFVMDNSDSMNRHWQDMAHNIEKFIQQLPPDVDIHYSVLLGDIQRWSGQLYAPYGAPIVLDNHRFNPRQISFFLQNTFALAMRQTDWIGAGETLFYSLYDAVTVRREANQRLGFFRKDAALDIIFMSDDAETGFPYPSTQPWGLPPKCNYAAHESVRERFYIPRGINTDSTFAAIKRMKGDMPVLTNAFVNITKEDILYDNDPHAACIFDSPGYGYFDMVAKTYGFLFSVHQDQGVGLKLAGQLLTNRLKLEHDFKLSQPASEVDPKTILAAVDGIKSASDYSAATDSVHLENAGQAGSLIEIQHCEPVTQPAWTLTNFAGSAAQTTAQVTWDTTQLSTSSSVAYGLSAAQLNETATGSAGTAHTVNISGLSPNTVYYFQATSTDSYGVTHTSPVISLRTEPSWVISALTGTASRNSASLAWSTAAYPTAGHLIYGTSPDQLTQSTVATVSQIDHAVTVTGLTPNTTYYFQAVSSDEFGQVQSSNVLTLHTLNDWAITGFTGVAARTSAVLSWVTADYPTSGKLIYGTSATALTQSIAIPTAATSQSVNVTGLTAATTYYFQAVADDDLGVERTSPVISLTTKEDWAIAGFTATSGQTTLTVGWNTGDYPTSGTLYWGSTADALVNQVDAGSATDQHGATVTGLSPDTLYYVQVSSTDDLAVEKRSAVVAVRTQPIPTPLPSWALANFQGSATTNAVALTWDTTAYATTGTVSWGTSADALTNTQAEGTSGTSHALTVSSLSANTLYYFQVTAKDDQGQSQTSSVIAVRTQAIPLPTWTLSGFAGTPTTTTVALVWNTPEYATKGKVMYGTSATALSAEADEASSATAHSLNVSGLTASTTYFFQVTATDDQGQTQTSPVIQVTTLTPPAPLPSWTLTNFQGTPTTTTVALTWDTSQYATSGKVIYGTSAASLNAAAAENGTNTAHSVVVGNLQPGTVYYFQAISTDDQGQVQQSPVIQVTTVSETPPLPSWALTDFAGVPTSNTVALTWNTSAYATTGKVMYGTSAIALTSEADESGSATAHALTVSSLMPSTAYFFQVTATDDQGQTQTSAVIQVATAAPPLPTWAITDFGGTPSPTSVALSWNTSAYATQGKVMYGTSATALTSELDETATSTAHSATVTGLSPSTAYYFQVTETDDKGQTQTSAVIQVTTTAVPLPVWSITDFAGTPSTNSVALAWNTSAYATQGKVMYGTSASALTSEADETASATAHSLNVTGLNPGTAYFFQVTETDDKGQTQTSAVIQVTTTAAPLPTWAITDFGGTPSPTTVALSWNTSAYATQGKVMYGTSAAALTQEADETASATAHSLNVTGLNPGTAYFFQVTETDDKGQTQTGSVIQVTTTAPAAPTWSISSFDGTTTTSSATLIWQTGSTPTTAVIHVGLSATNLTLTAVNVTTAATQQLVTIPGLNAGTAYFFQVVATDASGNSVTSSVLQKNTKAAASSR